MGKRGERAEVLKMSGLGFRNQPIHLTTTSPQEPESRHLMEPACQEQPNATGLPVSLLQLLSNTLVLYQTTPYLPVSSLLALGATSKLFKDLVHSSPSVFRHLDLTKVASAQFEIAAIDHGGEVWRNVQLDENVTEDELVSPRAFHNAC